MALGQNQHGMPLDQSGVWMEGVEPSLPLYQNGVLTVRLHPHNLRNSAPALLSVRVSVQVSYMVAEVGFEPTISNL